MSMDPLTSVEGAKLVKVVWLPTFFTVSYFVFNRRKKFTFLVNIFVWFPLQNLRILESRSIYLT